MKQIKCSRILTALLLVLTISSGVWSVTLESITQSEIIQTKELKTHLEVLKGHLENAIKKLDHNIQVRQTQFQRNVLTPDNEYIEAAIPSQGNNDFITAATIPEIPLPLQKMRITQNSGLRR